MLNEALTATTAVSEIHQDSTSNFDEFLSKSNSVICSPVVFTERGVHHCK